ncbi:hypothetical protein [Streptomyces brasiliscabiei]|uniref:hypothetical protein n=1 Tax=Streptomyces brasiliscabiei TaxID=2736302 RepID=UPI001C116995|nr:hypothetical protein [Streptomyces brasiliscabiei]
MSGFHVIDAATGEVVQELGRKWTVKTDRPRAQRKRPVSMKLRTQDVDLAIAAGAVLGCYAAFVILPW